MKKSMLRRSLSSAVAGIAALTLLMGSAIGAVAAEPNFGTEENGIATPNNGNDMNNTGPSDGFLNGDFQQGLKYWGDTTKGETTTEVDLVTEGENKYIKLTPGAKYEGLKTCRIQIAGSKVAVGDQLVVVFDYKSGTIGTAKSYDFQVKLEQRYPAAGANGMLINGSNDVVVKAATAANPWTTAYAKGTAKVIERAEPSTSTYEGDVFVFHIYLLAAAKLDVDLSLDNIRLAKLVDGKLYDLDGQEMTFEDEAEETGDPDWAGTEENGIPTKNGGNDVNNFGPTKGLQNGDFQKGLKYWGDTVAGDEVKTVKLMNEGENKYIKLTPSGDWQGVKTPQFEIPADKLTVGDKLVVVFDYKGTNISAGDFQVKLIQRFCDAPGNAAMLTQSGNDMVVQPATADNPWATGYAASKNALVKRLDTGEGYDGDGYVFQMEVICATNHDIDLSLDNFRLAKLVDGALYDLDGNKMEFGDGSGEEADPDAIYGTEEDGWATKKYSFQKTVPPMDYLKNADFSQGLKYWTCYGEGLASKGAKIEKDGDNTYAKLITETQYEGIQTALFKIEGVKAGDRLVAIVDWRGDCMQGDFQIVLSQWDMRDPTTEGGDEIRLGLADQKGIVLYEAKTDKEWNTMATPVAKAVQQPKNSDELYFAVGLDNFVGGAVDISFDNIRFGLLKEDNVTVTDLNGKPMTFDGSGSSDNVNTGVAFPAMAVAAIAGAAALMFVLRKRENA